MTRRVVDKPRNVHKRVHVSPGNRVRRFVFRLGLTGLANQDIQKSNEDFYSHPLKY